MIVFENVCDYLIFLKHILGEIYLIDSKAKEFFDEFEHLYNCLPIEVRDSKGNIHEVHSYILCNFKESLLNEDKVLFENYSSINNYYPPYVKAKPQNSRIITKSQVKQE